jgi:hypothetical protein
MAMKKIFKLLILVPLVLLVTLFAILNRGSVSVMYDPFDWAGLGQTVSVPMFLVIFFSAAAGVIAGGISVWLAQGRHRKAARVSAREAARQRAEVERLRVEGSPSTKPAAGGALAPSIR